MDDVDDAAAVINTKSFTQNDMTGLLVVERLLPFAKKYTFLQIKCDAKTVVMLSYTGIQHLLMSSHLNI